jgi:hypothetical protein
MAGLGRSVQGYAARDSVCLARRHPIELCLQICLDSEPRTGAGTNGCRAYACSIFYRNTEGHSIGRAGAGTSPVRFGIGRVSIVKSMYYAAELGRSNVVVLLGCATAHGTTAALKAHGEPSQKTFR